MLRKLTWRFKTLNREKQSSEEFLFVNNFQMYIFIFSTKENLMNPLLHAAHGPNVYWQTQRIQCCRDM